MHFRNHQRGMTLIGWIMTLAVIGFFALFAIRLTPVFLEYQSVASIMNNLTTEPANSTAVDLRRAIDRRLNINNVNIVKGSDFQISKTNEGTEVSIEYEARTGFIGNIDLLVSFRKSVTIGQSG